MREAPVVKDLVLVGGGHSHVEVLRRFAMRPLGGVRLTLVSRDVRTPYSGMLPGVVAGHYSRDAAFIDLVRLCRWSGARFVHGEARGLDVSAKTVSIDGRPALPYDVLSLNVGATPGLDDVRGDTGSLIRAKPIDRFLAQWDAFEQRARAAGRVSVMVVGGGAAGIELALAASYRLRNLDVDADLQLATHGDEILVGHNVRVRRRFDELLEQHRVQVYRSTRIVARQADGVTDARRRFFACDEVIWATQAVPPAWIASSGLAVDERGFMRVDACLRSASHPEVFGAGDVASSLEEPRPKAGVFAVRQGPVLAENLRAALLERRLKRYRPQRQFLSLISAGDRYAVASRGTFVAAGAWVWRWKDRIDRTFMERYQRLEPLPAMTAGELAPELQRLMPPSELPDGMRCGGCGAKIPAEALRDAIAGLRSAAPAAGSAEPLQLDDAATLSAPEGQLIALSIDAFRPLVEDPFVFGEICANHALNDLYAIGAQPRAALALVTLPVWPASKITAEWVQMMAGAQAAFAAAGAGIVGGHSAEGREVTLGFSVIGSVAPGKLRRKTGLRAGDALVLTKPLGTGTLLAADMRARAEGRWVAGAVECMRQSNRAAVTCLGDFDVSAMTDVTGFGLAGHLLEMLAGSDLQLRLRIAAVPVLDGAREMLAAGWRSSLHRANREHVSSAMSGSLPRDTLGFELLFDPQTAGGLVAGVPNARAEECVAALRRAGYAAAAVIGTVHACAPDKGPALLRGQGLSPAVSSAPRLIVD